MFANWWQNYGSVTMNCRIVDITPQLAGEWLERNLHNRRFVKQNYNTCLAQIQSGQWKLNGEPIIFAKDGRLLDGQHRLTAIRDSGITIRSYVIFDIDDSVFATIDTGRVRKGSDVLSMAGHMNCTKAAAVAKALHYWLSGDYSLGYRSGYRPSNDEILSLCGTHERIAESTQCGSKLSGIGKPSIIGFCHFVTSQNADYADKANSFWEFVQTGLNMSEGHPAHTLREKMVRIKTGKVKTEPEEELAYVFKAWNYFVSGKELRSIRYERGREVFPMPTGDELFAVNKRT